jgi:TatD DNase family protein
MIGLHPEEVKADWKDVLKEMRALLMSLKGRNYDSLPLGEGRGEVLAIGEVGLDYYWSREFEKEQLEAFEEQVKWSVETRLPLMIHCRKAQNEMVHILKRYASELPGGVFHCFTGNEKEAVELLQFERFVLGVGGVLTFKKSHLPEVLPQAVPLDRIVLETDAPYMAPVPHRGQRNEPAYVKDVLLRMAEAYGVSPQELSEQTNRNVTRVFDVKL